MKRYAPGSPGSAPSSKKKIHRASPAVQAHSSPNPLERMTVSSPPPSSQDPAAVPVDSHAGAPEALPKFTKNPAVNEFERAEFINQWMKELGEKDTSRSARFLATITTNDGKLLSRKAMQEIKKCMKNPELDVDVVALSRLQPEHLSRLNVDKEYCKLDSWNFMDQLWEGLTKRRSAYHEVEAAVLAILRDWDNLPTWVYKHEYASRTLVDMIVRRIGMMASAAGENVVTCPELSLASSARCSPLRSAQNPVQMTYCPGSVDYGIVHWPSSRAVKTESGTDDEENNVDPHHQEGESEEIKRAQQVKRMLSLSRKVPAVETEELHLEEGDDGVDQDSRSATRNDNNGDNGNGEGEGMEDKNVVEIDDNDADFPDRSISDPSPMAGITPAADKHGDTNSVTEMVDLLERTKLDEAFPGHAVGVKITSIEAKSKYEDLMDHVPQAIGQSLLIATRAGTTTDQDTVPFCLSNGFRWLFGVLAEEPADADRGSNTEAEGESDEESGDETDKDSKRPMIYKCYISPEHVIDLQNQAREADMHQDLIDVVRYVLIWITNDAADIVSSVQAHYGKILSASQPPSSQ